MVNRQEQQKTLKQREAEASCSLQGIWSVWKNALVLPFTHTQALVQSCVGHPTVLGRVKDKIKMCRKNW